MERDNRKTALQEILELARTKGFVTFDDILEKADDHSLSIGELDWLSETIHARNIIVYDESPNNTGDSQEEFDDYAQSDYEDTFKRVVSLNPALSSFVEYIKNTTPPQRGEIARLKLQAFEGNEYARTRMIEMYMRLAVRIAYQRAISYDYDIEEAIGDACIGLVIAVDKYNPYSSGPFGSFASMWIYQNISRRQPTQNPNVYFPAHLKDLYFSIFPYFKRYGCIECDILSYCDKALEMLCKRVNCTTNQASDVMISVQPCISLDEFYASNPEDERFIITDDVIMDSIEAYDKSLLINEMLGKLSERQREVIIRRFGFDDGKEKTLEQIGAEFGLTRERIRQIEDKAIKRLRYYLRGKRKP